MQILNIKGFCSCSIISLVFLVHLWSFDIAVLFILLSSTFPNSFHILYHRFTSLSYLVTLLWWCLWWFLQRPPVPTGLPLLPPPTPSWIPPTLPPWHPPRWSRSPTSTATIYFLPLFLLPWRTPWNTTPLPISNRKKIRHFPQPCRSVLLECRNPIHFR